ncbi:MAG: DEAD/DEAH box helicase [Acidobacteria bacterium]|nr:DEAD/DEAH box helicase [Acidobacteriota bacterium]
MLVEEQISERQERAKALKLTIMAKPDGQAWGDYSVKSPSGRNYRVAMRGPGLFENYCSCPDFAVNTLGTCKHIEALLQQLRRRYRKALESQKWKRMRASLSLHYGENLGIRLSLPKNAGSKLREMASLHFNNDNLLHADSYGRFHNMLEELRRLDETAVVYSDVLDFIDRENELAEGLETERRLLRKSKSTGPDLKGLLKVPLLPYQVRGALFLSCRGRGVLADDMGLGKTIQAIAAAELLRQRRGIQRVMVVAPASVKYQWMTEIRKFSDLPAQVIDGLMPQRKKLYSSPAFFNLTSYELVLKDLEDMQNLRPDLIILDEAQRIRNWVTATARTIKQLKSRYAFVLTGTPLENKLEELYSVVEFVDGRRLGPAFRFLKDHRIEDERGKLMGYRGLDQIHARLEPILLRRTRKEVMPDLPKRTDQVFRVPMTDEQAGPYGEQSDILARLIHKWERQGWLSEIDLRRITCCIQNMRMLCNSTFLFDKETHFSPKLDEFREIIRDLVVEENRKVLVFSEYERMTWLAGEALKKMEIDFVSLHGGVPGRKRGGLIERFRNDANCRVFLSTDAGGVGLNLQTASAVINFEPPWNPARLEQRIGRVHRMGQSQPVQVIHLMTERSIEERVWETLQLKKALFAALFDSPTSEVSFEKLGRKSVLQSVKEIFADQPDRPKPVVTPPPPAPVVVPQAISALAGSRTAGPLNVQPTTGGVSPSTIGGDGSRVSAPPTASSPSMSSGSFVAAGLLLEAGVRFLESLRPEAAEGSAQDRPESFFSNLVRTDPESKRPILAIPLPEGLTTGRISSALSGLLELLAPHQKARASASGS